MCYIVSMKEIINTETAIENLVINRDGNIDPEYFEDKLAAQRREFVINAGHTVLGAFTATIKATGRGVLAAVDHMNKDMHGQIQIV